MALRKGLDTADKASNDKPGRGGGKAGEPSGGVLLEAARKGLRPTGRSEGAGLGSPRSICEASDDAEQRQQESQRETITELSVAERRTRFLKLRSFSLSSSPVPSESVATSPPRASSFVGAGISTPTSRGRISPRPSALSDASSVASWGVVAEGRSRNSSISPRPSAPVSPNSYSIYSRSPSPQSMRYEQLVQQQYLQRSGGVPRPMGGITGASGGAGFGGGPGMVVSPKLRRPQAQRPQVGRCKTGEEKIGTAIGGDNGCGPGTLSGPEIEAAAFSALLKGGDSSYDASAATVGYDQRVEGRLGEKEGNGVDASGRVSRANSLDSVADSTAAEARAVALGSDLNYAGDGFVSDDCMHSQPTTPTVPQVMEKIRGLVPVNVCSISASGLHVCRYWGLETFDTRTPLESALHEAVTSILFLNVFLVARWHVAFRLYAVSPTAAKSDATTSGARRCQSDSRCRAHVRCPGKRWKGKRRGRGRCERCCGRTCGVCGARDATGEERISPEAGQWRARISESKRHL